ncbi:unnamed protein product [Victoria cruziana]
MDYQIYAEKGVGDRGSKGDQKLGGEVSRWRNRSFQQVAQEPHYRFRNYEAASRLASVTPPPAHVISHDTGWQEHIYIIHMCTVLPYIFVEHGEM